MSVVVGITGTNGKTSTAVFLRQLLTGVGRSAVAITSLGLSTADGYLPIPYIPATPGAIGAYVESLTEEGRTDVVIEASSEALARGDLDFITCDVAVMTSFAVDHLDVHGTPRAYAAAKGRLFERLDEGGVVVWPDNMPMWPGVARNGREVRQVRDDHGPEPFGIPFLDANARAALTAAAEIQPRDLEQISCSLVAPPGRMEHVATRSGAEIYVDYAHNAAGLVAALAAARRYATGRVLVAFGCGGNRDAAKRAAMGAAAAAMADVAIVTDDNPRSEDPAAIRAEIMSTCSGAVEVSGRSNAVRWLVRELRSGDVGVVAGRGHETVLEQDGRLLPVSDRDLVASALRATAGDARP